MTNSMLNDKESLFELMDKFEKSELSELTLKIEGQQVKMKKGGDQSFNPQHFAAYNAAHSTASAASHTVPQHAAPAPAAPNSSSSEQGDIISAPLVGTFYRASAPDAPAFVDVGSKVKAGDTLCILEAMKIMNELEAEYDCEILEILHDSGALAEFGCPLFKVKRI